MTETYSRALIVGAGSGLSASLARLLAREGMSVALAARTADWLRYAVPNGELSARPAATPTPRPTPPRWRRTRGPIRPDTAGPTDTDAS